MTDSYKDSEYIVGDFKVNTLSHSLCDKNGESKTLPHLTFTLLTTLISKAPGLVSQNELIQSVWSNRSVSDETLQQRVKLLRNALNDNPSSPKYIVTIRNKGYKLIAPVQLIPTKSLAEQTSKKVNSNLFWKLLSVFLVLISLVLGGLLLTQNQKNGKTQNKTIINRPLRLNTVAILPLDSNKSDTISSNFAQGLTTQLNLALSFVDQVQIIQNTELAIYKDSEKEPVQIGREINASAIIFGDVKKVNNKIKINLSMYDIYKDTLLWSKEFDTNFKTLFKTQTQIAEDVTNSLKLKLNPKVKKMLAQPTLNITAYEYYLSARTYINKLQKQDNEIAIELSQKAISLDPDFVNPHILLGFGYFFRYEHWDYPKSSIQETIKQAEIVLKLDPENSDAYFLLGLAHSYKPELITENWQEVSRNYYKKALELNPNNTNAESLLIDIYLENRNHAQALKLLYQIIQKRPKYVFSYISVGLIFEELNYNDIAIQWYEKALDIKPDYYRAMKYLSYINLSLGHYELAQKYVNKILERYPIKIEELFLKADILFYKSQLNQAQKAYLKAIDSMNDQQKLEDGFYMEAHINLCFIYQNTNNSVLADELLARIQKAMNQNEQPYESYELYHMALISAMKNENDTALKWLNKAVDSGFISDDTLVHHPIFSNLYNNGQLEPVLKRITNITNQYRNKVLDSGLLLESSLPQS